MIRCLLINLNKCFRDLRESCYCCGEWGAMDFQNVSRMLFISVEYNVILCWKLAQNIKFWKSLISLYILGSQPQKSPKIVQKRIAKSWFAQILHKNGIYCHTYSESSCPEGLEDVWQGGYRVSKAELWTAEVDPYLEWQKKGCGTEYIIGYFFSSENLNFFMGLP